jgi:hypothetical protein
MLALAILAILFFFIWRTRHDLGNATENGHLSGPSFPLDALKGPHGAHLAARVKRMVVVGVVGVAVVAAGGIYFGFWGLSVGTVTVVGGLAWALLDEDGGWIPGRRQRRGPQLSADEIKAFEEITARFDESRP